jgi:predicted amidophosphoribosyltransferase
MYVLRDLLPSSARAFAFAAFAKRAFQLALPNQCALCGNVSQQLLCAGCDEQYWNEPRFRCATCAMPLAPSYLRRDRDDTRAHCAECLENPPAFNDTLAIADYRAPLDTLAVELKFRVRLAAGAEFARHLHAIFEDSGLPTPDVIVPAQQSRLDANTRRRNVASAFVVEGDVRGQHIGVVDDVMTSGATLDALARTLKLAGARRVTNFVALRTPKD